MSKVAGVWDDASSVSTELLQRPTRSAEGPKGVIVGWVEMVDEYLDANEIAWNQVRGVGLAIPGPFVRYGVIGRSPNLPANFEGFDLYTAYLSALEERAGRAIPLTVGNDGNFGGVAEAHRIRGDHPEGTVLMLAPGSGLGVAYVNELGLPLEGDTLVGMEGGHMPALLSELGVEALPCGCGRTWGCIEMYTTMAGLPYLLNSRISKYPDHELARSAASEREKVFSLRGLAQKEDPLALEIFDFQARALGLHVANMAMAVDPHYVVIGGGLMDPGATTETFRKRYLTRVREAADPYLWPVQRQRLTIVPAALGDLSQAIGAALVALFAARTGKA